MILNMVLIFYTVNILIENTTIISFIPTMDTREVLHRNATRSSIHVKEYASISSWSIDLKCVCVFFLKQN